MALLPTILGLSLLIILHELGHFLVARLFGMRVLRFSIGFGPRLWSAQVGETKWQIAALPLGGFVQIDGMGPPDPETPEDARSFRNKPGWQRALVLFAGPAFNWLLAVFFIIALAGTLGLANPDSNVIAGVVDGPAKRAGLRAGDRIVAIGGDSVEDWQGLVEAIGKHAGEPTAIEIERGEARFAVLVQTEETPAGGHRLGVERGGEIIHYRGTAPIAVGLKYGVGATRAQLGFFWGLIVGEQEGELIGPPGIIRELSERAKRGARPLVEALAGLSITLFLINLLPIPALDGSRLLFVGIEAIRRRPVDHRVEAVVHGVGFLLLMALILFFSVRDLT